MTAHTCKTLDPNCYRCNLNNDEMKPDRMTDTNELRKLLAAATPTPWAVSYGDISWQVVGTKPNGTPDPWTFCTAFDDGSAYGEYAPRCNGPTRDLIVAAVNALPAMLDELDAKNEEVQRLNGVIGDSGAWAIQAVQEMDALRAEVERMRDMLSRLCFAVERSTIGYGVYEEWYEIHDEDFATLHERMDEAKALLAKHKEADQ